MKPPAAFRATYSDWKLIRTRKVVQIVLEVPIEEADIAYQVLDGMPNSGESIWCAVARLKVVAGDSKLAATPPAAQPDKPARRAWEDLSATQRAGICCNEPAFQVFLAETYPKIWEIRVGSGDSRIVQAAKVVRHFCRVESRSQINPGNPESLRLWQELERDYHLWQHAPEVA